VYFSLCRRYLYGESHKNFLCDVSWYVHENFGFKFRESFPLKILEPKNVDFIFTILGLYRKYFQNGTTYRQSVNGVANYNVSLTYDISLVYFGPQTAKNRTVVSTHPRSIIVAIISPAYRG